MKAISLGIISSIIFSIVLPKNSSGSRKKPKKSHTTTAAPVKVQEKVDFDPKLPNIKFVDEFTPITLEGCKGRLKELDELFVSETDGMIIDKVTGFSRRENNSSVSGCYIRPYEEDYEDMIKEEDAATLNGDEEFDVEIDPNVAPYLGDRENDGEGGETQGEYEENEGDVDE
ncbi:Acidic phosphoprotein precursor PCEMA1, putative [Plasmodium chabaudi chabaudi]|uniref:Acidic phosphoprotein PCEMA1, putative n=1 Tax=Plasmodium chabaudi chabaudi TaxID=31271 RepID=A0A1D3L7T5_PLACU|nr:Acidic phosphoprotein precursor PCEMA1, putative [Plasmodium chabaudi chabaudi]